MEFIGPPAEADNPQYDRRHAAFKKFAANMVSIAAGTITLKDGRTGWLETVNLLPFRINKFVVTQEEYLLISHDREMDTTDRTKPIVDVSWDDAIRFCNLLSQKAGLPACYSWNSTGEIACDWQSGGYRLPSEAEWEFACRAGSNLIRYGELDDIAWYRDNAEQRLHAVGTRQPNDWRLYDMIGNVWEWCWDVYDPKVYGAYRVFRGGGWCDPPYGCRASCRRKSHPTFHIDDLGFRIAQSLHSS